MKTSVTFRIFALCLLFSSTWSIKVDKSFKTTSYLREFERFGFDKGGTANIKVNSDHPENTRIFICDSSTFSDLVANSDAEDTEFCNERSAGRYCEFSSNSSHIEEYTVKSRSLYHFVIINCGSSESSVDLSYTLLNPGGEHLGVGSQPLPTLYAVFTVAWGISAVGWLGIWIYFRRTRVPLHTMLAVVIALKLSVEIVALSYWKDCQTTGKCLTQLSYLQSFLFAISETAFFCVLLLVSKGWRITRSRLPSSEIRTITVALILLLSTLLFFSFYNDGYYFLSLMIMYFFMLPKIFTSITRNTRALETQLILMGSNRSDNNNEVAAIHVKIRLFKTLRTAVVIYLGTTLLVNSLRRIMIWYLEWLNDLMNELVVMVMVLVIAYILLPHNRPLFATLSVFDGNLLPIFNMDDLFVDPELVAMSLHEAPGPDISEIVVLEYPSERGYVRGESPTSVPLALGIMEKPKDRSVEDEKEKTR